MCLYTGELNDCDEDDASMPSAPEAAAESRDQLDAIVRGERQVSNPIPDESAAAAAAVAEATTSAGTTEMSEDGATKTSTRSVQGISIRRSVSCCYRSLP